MQRIVYNTWNELIEGARQFSKAGFDIEIKGWEGMENNILTVYEGKKQPEYITIRKEQFEEAKEQMCDANCKWLERYAADADDADELVSRYQQCLDEKCKKCLMARL